MTRVTRRNFLKGVAVTPGFAAAADFPFVNRLALGDQPIKLGALYPFTGPMALEAQEMLAATQIAVDDVNAAAACSAARSSCSPATASSSRRS